VVLGAETGREPGDFGVTAERCSEACLTKFALSMTGFSAINDPKSRTSVKRGQIDALQMPGHKKVFEQKCKSKNIRREPFMERSWPPGVASCDMRRADIELGAVMVNAFA
jgi:hypothetical protein